ncbi:MAG TPA: ATP-binding protein [Gemmatirosa sp.]
MTTTAAVGVDAGTAAAQRFTGPGEMRARCRAFDWGATPLGPVARWSASLHTAAGIVLAAPTPMILLWGPELVQLYNDGYAAIMGAKHPAGLGQRNIECWPEVWDFTAPVYAGVRARGESFTFRDQRLVLERHGRPEETFFTLTYSPVPDDTGDVGGVLVTVVETTTQVHARSARAVERERLLAESEVARARYAHQVRLFDGIASTTPDFVYLFDRAGRFQYANRRLLEVWGVSLADAVGRTCLELGYEPWHHDMHMREIAEVIATQQPIRGEVPFRAPVTGIFGVYEYIFTPVLGPDGEVELVAGTTRDVTARNAAEAERARLLAESERARVDAEAARADVAAVNAQLETQALELERSTQQLQEQATELEVQAVALQRTATQLQLQADAAERARDDAEAARRTAELANQAKGLFLANMSHELRTPLNAIGGYAQLLDMGLHGPVTAEQHGALARIQAAQTRLLALINDVLNYAKLESGRVEYDVRAVEVGDVVRDVVPLLAPQLRAKGLAFAVRLPETACTVWADREKLGQVLVNLLSNAVKFTDPPEPGTGAAGCVTVSVATRADASPDAGSADGGMGAHRGPPEVVYLQVRDTGRGIPRDKQEAIFEPFVQVRTGYAQATEGTGLGLAISRDLARGMGGDLRVRSREGEGATFTVALRRAVAGAAAPADA